MLGVTGKKFYNPLDCIDTKKGWGWTDSNREHKVKMLWQKQKIFPNKYKTFSFQEKDFFLIKTSRHEEMIGEEELEAEQCEYRLHRERAAVDKVAVE